jgi:solute carrier family 35 protein F5
MLLTTPLVVTVGLSLTIPLSLVGEMIQYDQYASWIYWVGAAVVFLSFVFINHESQEEETPKDHRTESRPRTAESVVV